MISSTILNTSSHDIRYILSNQIDDIANSILEKKQELVNPNFLDGNAGIVLLFAYLGKLFPEKNYCHISFSDNGIGFDPLYKDKIFEVFQRLHGKEDYAGTGIGLAIVKKIVENHKGTITAKGELNIGATFDIYIPAA